MPATFRDGKTPPTRLSRIQTVVLGSGVPHVRVYSRGVMMHVLTQLSGQKHYSKQTVYDAHLTSKKHIKASQKQATSSEPPANPNGNSASTPTPTPQHQSSAKTRLQTSAYYTALTTSLLVTLAPVLNETKSNVERKFSLTAREREQELQEKAQPAPAPVEGAEEEEEEEERIYNPLKLPLGWDGKPIPYWLYKLHGLGVEYRCEICSDHVYMGRYVRIPVLMNSVLIHLPGKTLTATSKKPVTRLVCALWVFLTPSISTRSLG